MNNTGRYEVKFVFDELGLNEALSWLNINLRLRQEYPVRIVNSLYFDDINFQSVRDNLSGFPDRKKRRLRWYNDVHTKNVVNLTLEIKWRKGRLVFKEGCPLPELKDKLLSVESRKIIGSVNEILYTEKNLAKVFDEHLEPILRVSYERQYYKDIEGLRVTIDRGIVFSHIFPHNCLPDCPTQSYPYSVVEFKFPIRLKNYVSELMRYSTLQPKRHSKYLTGLAAYGLVQYA
jgi:SPX domain protein involved in polyphosphate accumulation